MISTFASGSKLESAAKNLESATAARPSFRQTYHEIANGRHVVELDVIEQLRANLAQLEDLHGRVHFMMSEVSYLLKKS